jgi:GNAT superfamily N-acetyltransferase
LALMVSKRSRLGPESRVVAERKNAGKIAARIWRGLIGFNRKTAGPLHYSRTVLTARSETGRILGGLILQSWWKESFVELLWLSERARGQGLGSALIAEAERRARRRGSKLLHLSTYSFQAPRFYEKLGFRCVGKMSGSPKGASRYYYMKRLHEGKT